MARVLGGHQQGCGPVAMLGELHTRLQGDLSLGPLSVGSLPYSVASHKTALCMGAKADRALSMILGSIPPWPDQWCYGCRDAGESRPGHCSAADVPGPGPLLLFMFAADRVATHMEVHIPVRTDHEGNAYAASKRSAKKWPCSALLMELSAQEQKRAVLASLHHVKRCSNVWADQLIHLDFAGFDMQRRILDGFSFFWILLPDLLA